MTFLGNFVKGRISQTTLEKSLVVEYVRKLFRREDFPGEIFVALEDSAVVSKGDVVWLNFDTEHPFDFIPLPRIDQLVLNIPSKAQVLAALGATTFDDVSREAEDGFWERFEFVFCDHADGVNVIWE